MIHSIWPLHHCQRVVCLPYSCFLCWWRSPLDIFVVYCIWDCLVVWGWRELSSSADISLLYSSSLLKLSFCWLCLVWNILHYLVLKASTYPYANPSPATCRLAISICVLFLMPLSSLHRHLTVVDIVRSAAVFCGQHHLFVTFPFCCLVAFSSYLFCLHASFYSPIHYSLYSATVRLLFSSPHRLPLVHLWRLFWLHSKQILLPCISFLTFARNTCHPFPLPYRGTFGACISPLRGSFDYLLTTVVHLPAPT